MALISFRTSVDLQGLPLAFEAHKILSKILTTSLTGRISASTKILTPHTLRKQRLILFIIIRTPNTGSLGYYSILDIKLEKTSV